MPRFNLGLFQKKFNSTSKVTGPAINVGCTRGRGSTTRMLNYCNQHSSNPSTCINQFINIKNNEPTEEITVPSAPEITDIKPGNAKFEIYFNPPTSNGGSPILDYYVTYDGGLYNYTLDTKESPAITKDILSNGLSYNVQIRAINAKGFGLLSNLVQSTPYTTPGVPQINSLTAGLNTITVNFLAPNNDGGSSITEYQYSIDNNQYNYLSKTQGTYDITGLTSSQSYPFTLRAVNAAGAGNASTPQNVTPT